jgi:hypothetical protein
LCTALHKEGFATEDSKSDHTAQGIDEGALVERRSSVDQSRSTPDDGLCTSESERAHYPSIIRWKPSILFFLPLTLCR